MLKTQKLHAGYECRCRFASVMRALVEVNEKADVILEI
jgi:hypothetical protein